MSRMQRQASEKFVSSSKKGKGLSLLEVVSQYEDIVDSRRSILTIDEEEHTCHAQRLAIG